LPVTVGTLPENEVSVLTLESEERTPTKAERHELNSEELVLALLNDPELCKEALASVPREITNLQQLLPPVSDPSLLELYAPPAARNITATRIQTTARNIMMTRTIET